MTTRCSMIDEWYQSSRIIYSLSQSKLLRTIQCKSRYTFKDPSNTRCLYIYVSKLTSSSVSIQVTSYCRIVHHIQGWRVSYEQGNVSSVEINQIEWLNNGNDLQNLGKYILVQFYDQNHETFISPILLGVTISLGVRVGFLGGANILMQLSILGLSILFPQKDCKILMNTQIQAELCVIHRQAIQPWY